MTEPRACILSCSGPELTAGEAALLADAQPWGMILMGRSCRSRAQVRGLTASIRAILGEDVLIFIDQEGGRVRRLRPPEWPDFPAAAVFGDLYRADPALGLEAAWLGHRLIAAELVSMGVRANCSPVVDVRHAGAHDIVGDRAFGSEPDQVSALARAALSGLGAGGVAGVIKHIPGHGRAELDSHEALPVVRASREELSRDASAFAALRDAPMAMTAHVAYAVWDDQACATHSPTVIGGVIRGEIGFNGLLMSDDLGMKALGGPLASRAGRAFAAGCDVALHCSGFVSDPAVVLAEMTEVASASPPLSGAALDRARAARKAAGPAEPFDLAAGRARLDHILSGLARS
jgi:beta-N-acetylhexosaminidase